MIGKEHSAWFRWQFVGFHKSRQLQPGGVQGREAHGIHWHVDPSQRIRYRSDPTREKIYDVELTGPDGKAKLYRGSAEEPAAGAETQWRTMDCVDCHNRPTHVYRRAEDELDTALVDGRIDRGLPYIRREGHRVLKQEYASQDEARQKIGALLGEFYAQNYPDLAASGAERIARASAAIGDIYSWNVFPGMKVHWDSYPNHIGHENSPGCFRCHDDTHQTAEGEVISQDCDTCHTLLAMEEENPEVLRTLKP